MAGRHDSERSCLVTREAGPPEGMIRFVVGPDATVVPDLAARLPGRGAWVTGTREAVAEAMRQRLFSRAFKRSDLVLPPDMPDAIEAGLRRGLRESLALANKAGAVVTGFAKVESAIGAPAGVAALVHAAQASPDGRRKLAGALYRRVGDTISGFPVIDDLSNDELDMALGRDHVIHAALVAGAGSQGCLARWRRLRAWRGGQALREDVGPVPVEGAPGTPPSDDRGDDEAVRGTDDGRSKMDANPQGWD